MKGREAARAARRREQSALAELGTVRAELAQERSRHDEEEQHSKTELAKLHGEIVREARRLADREVDRRLAEAEEERRRRGVSEELVQGFMTRQDKFVMNACRYLSMTRGWSPLDAMNVVWTWYTEEDGYGAGGNPVLMATLGLPRDGWVAWLLQHRITPRSALKAARTRRQLGEPTAITLEHAEEQGHRDIHPDYRRWKDFYAVDYRGGAIELVGDDGHTETVIR
jgi:hypothetical protein